MLESFKFWRRPLKRVWQLPQMAKFNFPAHIKVYLIGFSYDTLTTQTVTWIQDILVSRKINQDKIVRFNNISKGSKEEVAKSLEDNADRIEIFCGHGCHNGLYGPPQSQVAGSILTDSSFIIYDMDMITATPSSMFAFCCMAAQNFGRVFTSLKDKQFMGFKDDIPFPIELYEDLKYVFQTVAKNIIQEGRILDTHKNMFLEKIDEIASQASSYSNPTLIELWLDEYRKHLMVYC